ncbi:hypothetical protein EB118_19735 [bacterium]|nr:hypothetical protein [bacterium]
MGDEHIATYIYDPRLDYGVYEVYACYDSDLDKCNRNVSFYDVYDKNGICINEGDPFYEMPTWQEVFDKYYIVRAN